MHSFNVILTVLLVIALPLQPGATEQGLGTPLHLFNGAESGPRPMGIRLHGALALDGGPELAEISDLAWDQDEGTLYAVTDRGRLLHLRPVFSNGRLEDVVLLRSHPLRAANGSILRKKTADAEGAVALYGNNGIRGDSRLAISFERVHRVGIYAPDGTYLQSESLPQDLRRRRFYRNSNNGMEALTLHPQLGYLSAPEKMRSGDTIPIYSLKDGSKWHYPLAEPYGALVAIEMFGDDQLLILERAFSSLFKPLVITLSLARIDKANKGQPLQPHRLARFDSTEGWLTQNLEGLTHHRGRYFFMVSDDNGEPFLQTQLIYFEVMAP